MTRWLEGAHPFTIRSETQWAARSQWKPRAYPDTQQQSPENQQENRIGQHRSHSRTDPISLIRHFPYDPRLATALAF